MPAAQPLRFLTPRQRRPDLPLFVFLPGMDGTGQLFRAQTAGLEVAFDVRCLVIPPDDLTNWEDLTEQTIALIRSEMQREAERTIYLCGESFGGCLALKVALHSPHLFKQIILVNPATSFNRRPWIYWGSQLSRLLPQPLYQASCVAFMPLLASLGYIEADDRRALLEAMLSVTQESSIWRLSLLHEFEVSQAALQRLHQSVLVIGSGGDRLLPSRVEAELLVSQLPNARLYVLPTSGHACMLESQVNLYEIMKASGFLEKPLLSTSRAV